MEVRYERESNGMTTITVEVPTETVDEVYQQALKDVKKHVSVPGFRRGKVPPRMVESIVGKDQILDMSKELLERKVFPEAMNELKELLLLGEADVELLHLAPGKPCEMAIKALTAKVQLPEFGDLTVERWRADVDDATVEAAARHFYTDRAEYAAADHSDVRQGDSVVFALRIVRDGFLADEYGEDDPLRVEIGNNKLNPNIDEHLLGLMVDQEVTFDVTYPEDYHDESFRGQTVDFTVKVTAIEARESFEAFAARQSDEGTVEALYQQMREFMERERKSLFGQVATEQVLQKAIEAARFDIPRAHLEATVMDALEGDDEDEDDEDDDLDDDELDDDDLAEDDGDEADEPEDEEAREARIRAEVEQDMKRSLLLRAVLKRGDVEFKSDDIMPELTTIAIRNRIEPRVLMQRLADSGDLDGVVQMAANRKAAEFILQQAQVTEIDPPAVGDDEATVAAADAAEPAAAVDEAPAEPAAEE